jgi:hypothetical protein
LWLAGGAIGLALIVPLAWNLFSSPDSDPPDQVPTVDVSELPRQPVKEVDSPPPKRQGTPQQPAPRIVDARWLPRGSQAVLSVRLPKLLTEDELIYLLRRVDPLWAHGVRPLVRGLGLTAASLRRVTWAVTNVLEAPRQAIFIIELDEALTDSDAARWLSQLETAACDFKLGDFQCHHRKEGLWTHPFALVEPGLIVSGPLELMRGLAQSAGEVARGALPTVSRLVEIVDSTAELVLLADCEALRQAGVDLPAVWTAAHSDVQQLWRSLRALPQGAAVQVSLQDGLAAEVQLLCADEAAANTAQLALEKILGLLPSILGAGAQALLEQADARDLDAAVFTEALRALSQAKTGRRDATAWARLTMTTEASQFAATAWGAWKISEYIHREPERADPRLAVDLSGLDLKLTEVEYRQAALAGFVEDMSRLAHVPIAIDLDALAELGLSQESKVSVKQTGVTIAAALREALEPQALELVIGAEGALVTTKQRRQDEQRTVEYDISDLAPGAAAAAELAELCRRLVMPASWAPKSQASLAVSGGKLQARQSGEVHDELLLLLEKLRIARGLPSKQLKGMKLDTRFARVRDRLTKEVTVNFAQATPLARIAAFLGQRSDLKLMVDGVALRRVGFDPAEGATVTAEKEPLFDVLDRLCKPLEIGWRIVDDKTLQITSRVVAERAELEFYPLSDLLGAGGTATDLMSHIRQSLASETWSPAGQGVLHYDAASRCLLILQSQGVHLQVEGYLATERAKKAAKPEDSAPAKR